ncbi:hypothetical protein Q3G72_005064 [Acer saccharum]|nr:hypothetical protein Q3G72_005064 [Acer saccharum]
MTDGSWNDLVLRQYFLEEEAKIILSLPTSSTDMDDSLLWHFDKTGNFLVRNGYWVAKAADSTSSGSGLSLAIPTRVNLASHGLKLDTLCPLCSQKNESSLHALWQCSSLKIVCSNCCISSGGKALDSSSFLDFVLSCKDRVNILEFEVLCVVWWHAWYRRNQLVHSNVLIPEVGVLEWENNFI